MARRKIKIGRRTITIRAGGKTITIPRGRGGIRQARLRANKAAKAAEVTQRSVADQKHRLKHGRSAGSGRGSVKRIQDIPGLEQGINKATQRDAQLNKARAIVSKNKRSA